MKKLFLLSLLLSSAAFAEERYETNVPDIYIKNFECSNGNATFNLVNKSNKFVNHVYLNIFDDTGDPIDKLENQFADGIPSQSGKSMWIVTNCKKIKKFGFSVNAY
jgi:hypothetical protein